MTNEETLKMALEAFKEIANETYDSWTNGAKAQRIAQAMIPKLEKEQAKQEQDEPDDLMIAYMSGLHDGKKLAKQEQGEPVAWMQDSIELYVQDRPSEYYTIPLYTTLYSGQQHIAERKPLTDEQIEQAENQIWNTDQLDEVERQANKEFVRAIEAAHGIKE